MPRAYAYKSEEEEERERKKRKAIEKQFEKGKDYNVSEVKIKPPKVKTGGSKTQKQDYETSLKTSVQEKDIVIDQQGTVSKKYEAKQTLEVSRTEQYAVEQQMKKDEEKRRQKERERRVRVKVTSKESAEATEKITRKKRLLKNQKMIEERMNKQKKEGVKRTRDIEELKSKLRDKGEKVDKEIALLQKILLGPFKSKEGGKEKIKQVFESLDSMIKSLVAKKK